MFLLLRERESRFYNRYFIDPKKNGCMPPIIDLRQLNHSEDIQVQNVDYSAYY